MPASAYVLVAIPRFCRVQRLVPGFVVDCRLNGNARTVTFEDGRVRADFHPDSLAPLIGSNG
jgi:hypothetical protein